MITHGQYQGSPSTAEVMILIDGVNLMMYLSVALYILGDGWFHDAENFLSCANLSTSIISEGKQGEVI